MLALMRTSVSETHNQAPIERAPSSTRPVDGALVSEARRCSRVIARTMRTSGVTRASTTAIAAAISWRCARVKRSSALSWTLLDCMRKHCCARCNSQRVPGEILVAEPLSRRSLVMDLSRDAERRGDTDRGGQRRTTLDVSGLQHAVGNALDERRHEEVLDLVDPEPAVMHNRCLGENQIRDQG